MTGQSTRSVSQFVVKVSGRCDLACDHCYVFEHADQGWRRQPALMDHTVLRRAAKRIADHAAAHRLSVVRVVLHGGEPLLLGPGGLATVIDVLRAAIEPVTRADIVMQSNGVLLDEQLCRLFVEKGLRIGISLDGDRSAHDRHRRFRHGDGSHAQTLRAIALLRRPEFRPSYAGLLCTVDVANDPIATYRALVEQEPPRVDFLLPHHTWDDPPLRPPGEPNPYAGWLLRVYRQWVADNRPVPVRMFASIRSTRSGGPSGTEAFGLDVPDVIVIESDGSWEQPDSLKTAFDGAAGTDMTVFDHAVDDVVARAGLAWDRSGPAGLPTICRSCPVVRQCGGGLLAHRYRTGHGFDNPSVYCPDLYTLISSINREPTAMRSAAATAESDRDVLDLVDLIADGYGDEHAIGYLADAQAHIGRNLVAKIGQQGSGPDAEAWSLLLRCDRADPAAVAHVLTHPYVRTWAVDVLAGPPHDPALARAYLSWLAAAAAVRAAVTADISVPLWNGRAVLPTVGTLTVPGAGSARLSTMAGGRRFRLAGRTVDVDLAADGWHPAVTVSTAGLHLLLEDADPYRDRYEWPAGGRLAPDDVAAWTRTIGDAWRLVRDEAPAYAAGISRGLRTLTPIADPDRSAVRSATSRYAFGALAATAAPAEALTVGLVHEFQHSKLSALMDLVDLFDPDTRLRVAVGWRPEPRPIEGALQGIYAHVAVADVWRMRAFDGLAHRPDAARMFRRYHDWTRAAIDEVATSGALTPAGTRLVDRLSGTMDGWPT